MTQSLSECDIVMSLACKPSSPLSGHISISGGGPRGARHARQLGADGLQHPLLRLRLCLRRRLDRQSGPKSESR